MEELPSIRIDLGKKAFMGSLTQTNFEHHYNQTSDISLVKPNSWDFYDL